MEPVPIRRRSIEAYVGSVEDARFAEIERLARPLRGLRVLHVNATPVGGGVAEILQSQIGLLHDLGIAAEWRTIVGEPAFFEATKAIHNALQGSTTGLTAEQEAIYVEWQRRNAELLPAGFDVVVIHDPQPMGVPHFAGRGDARWIWRLHVDSSQANPRVWSFLRPYLEDYDLAVFTMPEFAPRDVPTPLVRIVPPAIDPLTPKNRPIPYAEMLATLQRIGVDLARPMIAQISRFDPWKDPIGVIDAYRQVRDEVPGLQLVLLGVIAAKDDPEAVRIAAQVRDYAERDPDIHIHVDPAVIGQREVAAVQQGAQVVLQKSLKEGFGLTVSEALWKATPVVGGRVGGIPLQIEDGTGGFLVVSVEEAAERTRWLLDNPGEARVIGARGRERVRERFLITRLLADELRLYGEALGTALPDDVEVAN